MLAIVAAYFTKVEMRIREATFLFYDFLAAHAIAWNSQKFGIVDPEYLERVDFPGRKATSILLYDLEKNEIVYNEIGEKAKEILDEALKNIPGKPGDNIMIDSIPIVSYYALPVGIREGEEIKPGVLIVASTNVPVPLPSIPEVWWAHLIKDALEDRKTIVELSDEPAREIIKEFEWYSIVEED